MAKIKKTGRHTGALKAHRQSLRRRSHNNQKKTAVKNLIKELGGLIKAKDKAKSQEVLSKSFSRVDKAVKTGVYHWRTGARMKSRLSRQVAALNGSLPVAA
ncbi:MAG: 30S ribosomal protein S20 [Elusimicrobiota bacterium]